MRRDAAVLGVTAIAGTKKEHGGQRDPAAHRMHHDGAGEIVEGRTKSDRQPVLDAEGLVPGDALEERIDETDEQEGCGQLRIEARALGNAAGDDRRDGRGKGQQEEELGQLIAVLFHQRFNTGKEIDAVGDAVADEEVGDGRHGEIGQDLDQGIDLALLADRADLEKGEAGMHGEDHDAAQQNEQDVAAGMQIFHESPQIKFGGKESKHHSSA